MTYFALGDDVEWDTPCPNHKVKRHRGTVIEVVDAGSVPELHGQWRFTPRSHASYVIQEDTYHRKHGKKMDAVTFWPPVKRLRRAEK